ncbi:MAG: HAD family phosphatase [Clostridia bacterium]|nr:HAD family phosphatase [Clostridia bacterium]
MKYKLLALDIDGTLLNSEKQITDRVRKAVRAAVDKGCFVLLATGRMYRAMYKINQSLGLTMPCMVYGGGQIVKDGKIIYECPLDPDMAHEVLNWAHEIGAYAQAYDGDDFVFEKTCCYSDEYAEFCNFPGVEMPNLRERKDLRTPKILFISEPENIVKYERMAHEKYGSRLQISTSKPRFMEINNPNASKGNALDFLVKSMGLTAENCITMGDATLDLPMIEYAGLGVAMGNADSLTKSRADLICPTNDEDGVAWVIENYILNDPT